MSNNKKTITNAREALQDKLICENLQMCTVSGSDAKSYRCAKFEKDIPGESFAKIHCFEKEKTKVCFFK